MPFSGYDCPPTTVEAVPVFVGISVCDRVPPQFPGSTLGWLYPQRCERCSAWVPGFILLFPCVCSRPVIPDNPRASGHGDIGDGAAGILPTGCGSWVVGQKQHLGRRLGHSAMITPAHPCGTPSGGPASDLVSHQMSFWALNQRVFISLWLRLG